MNIKFKYITIQGFKSFDHKEIFYFPDGNGLYHLTGENRVETKISPNGCGKTTISDALVWCHYGKTPRETKADTIVNREGTYPCVVSSCFNIDDKEYTVSREQISEGLSKNGFHITDPNSIEGSKFVLTQDEHDELLKMNYDAFLRIVVMGQTNDFFFDLPPSEKLQVFSSALNLDYWIDCSNNAKEELKKIDGKLSDVNNQLARIEGQESSNKQQLVDLQNKKDAYENTHRVDLYVIDTNIKAKKIEIDALSDARVERSLDKAVELDILEGKYIKALNAYNDFSDNIKGSKDKVDTLYKVKNKTKEAYDIECNNLKSLQYQLDRQIESLEQLEKPNLKCNNCGQELTAKAKEIAQSRYDDRIKASNNIIEGLQNQIKQSKHKELMLMAEAAADNYKKAYDAIRPAEDDLSKLNDTKNNCKYAFNLAKAEADAILKDTSKVDYAKKELQNLENSYKKLKEEKNPYVDSINSCNSALDNLGRTRSLLKDDYAKYEKQQLAAKYWVDGFKQLRLWLIEEAIQELELETASILSPLGLSNWQISFDIEKENKSGTVAKEFSVMVYPPDSKVAVPWKSFSGGETQRLRIAGNVALANLLCNRLGISVNAQIWDEPTAGLSISGIDDLIECFATLSNDKQIWLIDHRSLNSGAFSGITRVIKEDDGCFIEVD